MKKKITITFGVLAILFIVGSLFASNYFYNESVKRGVEVELHKEEADVNKKASPEDQSLMEEARRWYNEQSPEILEITSYDDLILKAKYIKNSKETDKAVILAHGYRKDSNEMGHLAKFYFDEGFDVLLPDARGHGESEGDYIGYGWHDRFDYKEWIRLLMDEHNIDQIVLHGNSMGASLVLMTSGEELPEEVKAIVADSGYTTVKEELTHQLKHLYNLPSFPLLDMTSLMTKLRAGYTFEEASAIDQVRKNKLPLWIVHGEDDDLVPVWMAHELYEAAGGEKELWIVPDSGHIKGYENRTGEYQQRLREFLSQSVH